MQPAAVEKQARIRRVAAECGRCLRDPLRPVYRLIFWFVRLLEENRAVRWLTPFQRVLDVSLLRSHWANLKTLCDALGWTAIQKAAFRKQHTEYLARMNVQFIRLGRQTPADLLQSVCAKGEENIVAALREGRGVLLLGAHTGNFFHIPLFLAARGHTVRVIVNPGMPRRVGRYLLAVFDRFSARFFYVGTDSYDLTREAFRNGEIVFIAADHSLRLDRSRWVPYGPVELPMDPGPAILALRQKAPVIWGRAHYDSTGRSCVEYSRPLSLAGPGPGRPTPESVLRLWSELFYEHWQRHPAQWWAMNIYSLRPGANLKSPQKTDPR